MMANFQKTGQKNNNHSTGDNNMADTNQKLMDAYCVIYDQLRELIFNEIGNTDKLNNLLLRASNTMQTPESPMFAGINDRQEKEGEDREPEIDDVVKYCPKCETPSQFGELCPVCKEQDRCDANQS